MGNTMGKKALKPCPFCGSEPYVQKTGSGAIAIKCSNIQNNCPASQIGLARKDIVDVFFKWNDRPTNHLSRR